MAMEKNLIMVPYAEIPSMETGTSVAARKIKDRKAMYLKNACVSLVSAKSHNPECAVALVTNIDVPLSYAAVLKRGGGGGNSSALRAVQLRRWLYLGAGVL